MFIFDSELAGTVSCRCIWSRSRVPEKELPHRSCQRRRCAAMQLRKIGHVEIDRQTRFASAVIFQVLGDADACVKAQVKEKVIDFSDD